MQTFNLSAGRPEPAKGRKASSRASIMVYGSKLHFSDTLATVIRSEYPGLEILRSDDLRDLENRDVRALILGAERLDAFADNFEVASCVAPNAVVVQCFEHLDSARSTYQGNRSVLSGRLISFLPMNVRFEVWMSLLRLFLLGQTFIPCEFFWAEEAHSLSQGAPCSPAASRPFGGLTQRETEVLAWAAKGFQNKLIASQLEVSEHTVKLHMHNVIRKLGVRNRTEAAHLYHSESS